jgi:hypothetical protein
MAQRDDDNVGEGPRYPVRARRMDRPVRDEGTRGGDEGRPGYNFGGAERGYNQGGRGGLGGYQRGYRPGSYDALLERTEARRGPARPPKGYQRADDRIREDVCEQLMEGPVDVGDVEVTVKDGEVTLSGRVEERWEKRIIEDIAVSVRGVHDVHNRVRVRPPEEARESSRMGQERPRDKTGEPPHMGT